MHLLIAVPVQAALQPTSIFHDLSISIYDLEVCSLCLMLVNMN